MGKCSWFSDLPLFDKIQGWGDEFKGGPPQDLLYHALVKQPRGLTDRGWFPFHTTSALAQQLVSAWNKIMPTLLEVMAGIKAERLEVERRVALANRVKVLHTLRKEYVASQPLHAVIPEMGDLVDMEPFRVVIMDTPPEKPPTAALFLQAMDKLPALIDEWRKTKDGELLAIMKASLVIDDDATESILHLASTFFTCNRCYNQTIGYPQVLVHSCFTLEFRAEWSHVSELAGSKPWKIPDGSFNQDIYSAARSTLEVCGYDPDTMDAQDIADTKPLIECLDCMDETSGRLFMGYRNAVCDLNSKNQI